MSDSKYYSIDKLMSMNGVYNFCLGGRGIGKTYGFKKYVIDRFFKKGKQFIYLRRYKPELRGRTEFFADIAHLYPDWEFRIQGHAAQCAPVDTREDKKREWLTMGWFIALSQAQNEKSVPRPNVDSIIYDEFILENARTQYLPEEHKAFMGYYSSVDRDRGETRVFFLANTVSITNPYFIAWKIRPDEGTEIQRMHGGFIVCHFPEAADYKNEFYESRFGKFIKNTEFADFAVEALFADGHLGMVDVKPEDAKYQYTLELSEGVVSVWYYGGKYYHVQQKRPGDERIVTLNADTMAEHKIMALRTDRQIGMLRTAFRHGRITFDEPETRNLFIDIFKR